MSNTLGKDALLALLKTYEEKYYSGEAIISDEEYDGLKETYVNMYGEYDFVPSENTGEMFEKVKHLYPLKSLDKINISEEDKLKKELERLWPVIIEPKFDGLSIEIQYVNNKLKFVTRGKGEVGDDVTAQCMQIEGTDLLENLFINDKQSFRTEILMTHSDFEAINKRKAENDEELLSNCRNAAAGMLRNKDLSKVEGLTIMFYEDLSSTAIESREISSINDVIRDLGFDSLRVTPIYKPANVEEAIVFLKALDEYRKLIDYDIDGFVVKSNIANSLEVHGGYTDHHPKNAFAVKGEAKGAWTPIKSVTWQVGKEYITPVAELEPVEIEGSIISRCTLHNISILKALGLENLCYYKKINPVTKVKVIKANDVIPRIVEIKHPDIIEDNVYFKSYMPPDKCPVCGEPTAIKETDSDSEQLICTNENCSAKLQKRIEQMCSRDGLNIVGMSEGTIKKILDAYDVASPVEIFNITVEDLLALEGFAEKSADKLYRAIQNATKEQNIDKIMYASAMPNVGRDASKKICSTYSTDDLAHIFASSKEIAKEYLLKVEDVGEITAESLIAYRDRFINLCACIDKKIDIKSNKPKPAKQKIFCITGTREPYKTMIEEAGHRVSGSISKKNTFALVNDSGDNTSSKAKKALELNLPIITNMEELKKIFNEIAE